jgi:hypothetical protein
VLDLIGFANQSIEGARDVGMFQQPQGGFGRGGFGGRGGGAGDADAAAGRGGRGGARPTPPATTVAATDVEYVRTISDRYRELTGIRTAPATRIPGGAFFEYGYYQFGVPSFSTPGWGIAAPAAGSPAGPGGQSTPGAGRGGRGGEPAGAAAEPASAGSAAFDLRLIRWMDAEKVEGFVAWQPFKHPTLGDVEIGGFRPYALSNPAAANIAALGKSHAEFVTYLSSVFPRVSIASTSVTSHGGGIYRVKAEVENSGLLPTASAQGVRSRSVKPTMVQIGVAPEDIISGSAKTSFFPALAGSGRRETYEWIIKGKPGSTVTLKAVAQKGGTATATVTLK